MVKNDVLYCAEAAVTHFVFALQLLPRWIKDIYRYDLQAQTCHICVVAIRSISVMNSRECPIEILPFQPLPLDFNPKTKYRVTQKVSDWVMLT